MVFRGGANQIETMNKIYIVSWATCDPSEGCQDNYERFDSDEALEEAKQSYANALNEEHLYTASLSIEIEGTDR